MAILVSVFLFLSGLGYLIFEDKMRQKLTRAHGFLLLLGGIIVAVFSFVQYFHYQWDYSSDYVELEGLETSVLVLLGQFTGLLMILSGSIIYLVNMIMAALKPPGSQQN